MNNAIPFPKGKPNPMPHFPPDQDEADPGFLVTIRVPSEDMEVSRSFLIKAISEYPPVLFFVKRRSWGNRLFSRPWRPWHNVRTWTATGLINFFEIQDDDEGALFKVCGQGELLKGTARHV